MPFTIYLKSKLFKIYQIENYFIHLLILFSQMSSFIYLFLSIWWYWYNTDLLYMTDTHYIWMKDITYRDDWCLWQIWKILSIEMNDTHYIYMNYTYYIHEWYSCYMYQILNVSQKDKKYHPNKGIFLIKEAPL